MELNEHNKLELTFKNVLNLFPHFLVMSRCNQHLEDVYQIDFKAYFPEEKLSLAKDIMDAFNYNLNNIVNTFSHVLESSESDENIKNEPIIIEKKTNDSTIKDLFKEYNIDSKDFISRFSKFTINNFTPNYLEPNSYDEKQFIDILLKTFTKEEINIVFMMLYKRIPKTLQN